MKKFISLLLVIAMLVTMLVACRDKTDPGKDGNGTVSGGASETGDDTIDGPDLPDTKWNREFRVLSKGTSHEHWKSRDLTADELGSDSISYAVYKRNAAIADRYGITVQEYAVADYFAQDVEARITCESGSDDYDMFCIKPEGVISGLINQGYLMDLRNMEYMDLTAPWYDQNSISQLSIGNHVYLVTGSMLIMDDDATGAVFFNKNLLKANSKIPDLYALVDSGEWTIDRMTEVASYAAIDENGDDIWTVNEDTWGCLSEASVTLALVGGGGLRIIAKDPSTDLPYLAAGEENYLLMLEKVLGLQNNFNVTMFAEAVGNQVSGDVWVNGLDKAFTSDRALFYACWLNRATLFRDMKTDYGILPYPKYDEAQKDYWSFVSLYCANSISVPKSTPSADFVSFAIEALSAESMLGTDSLTEAYYEKALGARDIRDEQSKRMIDIIFGNTLFDLGYMFNWGGISSTITGFSGTAGGTADGFPTKMAAIQKSLNKAIEKTVEVVNRD